MKHISLTKLKANGRGKVAEIMGGANLQSRLMNMGVYKGREVTKLSHIGLRGPVVLKVGRGIMALGHNIAVKIIIEVT